MSDHMISWMIFLPLLGVLLQPLLRKNQVKWISLLSSFSSSLCAFGIVFLMTKNVAGLQLEESWDWISTYSIQYRMGVDGMNILLVVLMAILFPTLIACEWNRKESPSGLMSLLLILQMALVGCICAQDLFLQFFFWSLSSLPFYFLTGIWGGVHREKASFRAFVAGLMGNAFLFAALILMYYAIQPHSFSIKELSGSLLKSGIEKSGFAVDKPFSMLVFILFSLGLCLRIPIWPMHGWFTQFMQEAPWSVLVAFCAGMVPVATGLFVRVCYFLFPHLLSLAGPWIAMIGLMNLVMGVFCAATQKTFRGLLAFVCLGQIGLILVGIGSLSLAGLMGAMYQQLMSGLSFAALSLMLGVLAERSGEEAFESLQGEKMMGGLVTSAPFLASTCAIAIGGLLGLPGSGNFIGQALIFFGAYSQNPFFLLIASAVHVLMAALLFHLYRSIFLGAPSLKPGASSFFSTDLGSREKGFMVSLLAGVIIFGVYPKFLVDLIRPTSLMVLTLVKSRHVSP